jgi:hypothetical protein
MIWPRLESNERPGGIGLTFATYWKQVRTVRLWVLFPVCWASLITARWTLITHNFRMAKIGVTQEESGKKGKKISPIMTQARIERAALPKYAFSSAHTKCKFAPRASGSYSCWYRFDLVWLSLLIPAIILFFRTWKFNFLAGKSE